MNNLNISNTLRSIILGLALICLVIGFLIGSTRAGRNAGPEHLSETYLDIYVVGLASNFAQNSDANLVKHGLCFGDALSAAESRLASGSITNPGTTQAYQTVLPIVRGETICADYVAQFEPEGSGFFSNLGALGTILRTLLAVLVIALLIGALAWFFLTRRGTAEKVERAPRRPQVKETVEEPRSWDRILRRDDTPEPAPAPRESSFRKAAEVSAPATTVAGGPQQIGGFSTTYTRGDDAFDKSFIIENGHGDFLGECGVSISEYVNTDDGARNVTAFEIWLFDKNDTHTVTKVIMSDHAFGDEATRAKLAVRGESVLASLNETVALETNALIINANVNDLVYANTNPSRGVFDRFTIDLSAWVKSQLEQASGSASDMLNF